MMAAFSFFSRPAARRNPAPALLAQLGKDVIACQVTDNWRVPPGLLGLQARGQGQLQRCEVGEELCAGDYLLAPGPYPLALPMQAACPGLQLALSIVLDKPDHRFQQQRFEAYLLGEAGVRLQLADLQQQISAAWQRLCTQRSFYLPSCPSLDEWQEAKILLEKLLYLRFGWSVEDCWPQRIKPVFTIPATTPALEDETWLHDLSPQADAVVEKKVEDRVADSVPEAANQQTAPCSEAAAPSSMGASSASSPAQNNLTAAQVLRRYFLELPLLAQAWQQLSWPRAGADFYACRQILLTLEQARAQVLVPPHALLLAGAGFAHPAKILLDDIWDLLASFQARPLVLKDWQQMAQTCARLLPLLGMTPAGRRA